QRLNKTGSQNLYSSNAYFTSSIDGELASATTSAAATLMPTLIATSSERAPGSSSSDSFSFNAGATSTNTVIIFLWESPSGGYPTSATFNGSSLTIRGFNGNDASGWGYLVNPSPGTHTFSISYPSQVRPLYRVFVFKNVNQTTPYEADGEANAVAA